MDFAGLSAGLVHVAQWIKMALDAVGIVVIAVGAVSSLLAIMRRVFAHERVQFTEARLELARYLALALEFQLAADLVDTAISPTWERLGQLAAIATIRTALNYFLGREMEEERETLQRRSETPE